MFAGFRSKHSDSIATPQSPFLNVNIPVRNLQEPAVDQTILEQLKKEYQSISDEEHCRIVGL